MTPHSSITSDLEITNATLQDWLNQNKPVIVLDVRTKSDYDDWHIAEAQHVDVYNSIKYRQPGALADLEVPKNGTPVVTVCYVGQTSQLAAHYLRSRGINAYSMTGGMQWWSLAWNIAEVPFNSEAVSILQVRRAGKGCLSYIVASANRAIIIDPSVDPQVYLDLASDRNWNIERVLESHIHADHLTRGRVLAEMAGASYHLPQQERVSFPHEGIQNGDQFDFGTSKLRAMHTPGHTFESMSFLLDDKILFSGDTLFTNGIGRPDIAAKRKESKTRAKALFDSLQLLISLPEDTLILPAHTSRPIPFDNTPIMASLDEARTSIQLLQADEKTFIKTVLKKLPPTPPNHLQIIQFNESGIFPRGDVTILEGGANRCAV